MAGNSSSDYIELVALTAEMVINAFSMARLEVCEMIGKTVNKPCPFIKIVASGNRAVAHEETA